MKNKSHNDNANRGRSQLFYQGDELAAAGQEALKEQRGPRPAWPQLGLLPCQLVPGEFNIICSLPCMGKSAYLINLAAELQDKKLKTAVFLTEDEKMEFSVKSLVARSGVGLHQVSRNKLESEDDYNLYTAAEQLGKYGLFVAKQYKLTPQDLRRHLLDLQVNGDQPDAVLIDSINYLTPDEEWDEPHEILASLAGLAKDFKTTLICSYRVKSACLRNPDYGRIILADTPLADYGRTFASNIYQLHREEYFKRDDPCLKNKAELIRLHPYLSQTKGHLPLKFENQCLRFTPIESVPMIVAADESIIY